MMADHGLLHAALHSDAPGAVAALDGSEVWSLVAPWLGYVFLAAAAILGLFTASDAPDGATYAAGMATFAVAGIIIAVRMKRQLDGRRIGVLLPVAVAGIDTLIVEVAVLTVLGLVGAILAATVGGTLYGIGLALLVICAGLIFNEIRRYFDALGAGH